MKTHKLNYLTIFIVALSLSISTAKARPFDINKDKKMDCTILNATIISLTGKPIPIAEFRDKVWLRYAVGKDGSHTFSTSFGSAKAGASGTFVDVIPTTDGTEAHEILSIRGRTDPQMISTMPELHRKTIMANKHNIISADGYAHFGFIYNVANDTWRIFGLLDSEAFKTPPADLDARDVQCTVE